MQQVYGMKVIVLTRGDLMDVQMFFSEAWSKVCHEKSADVIVVIGYEPCEKKSMEVSRDNEGLNLVIE